jgi:hypothetical protein
MTLDVAATNSHDIVWATCTLRILLISLRAGAILRYDGVSSSEAVSRTRVGSSVDTLLEVDRAVRFAVLFKFCCGPHVMEDAVLEAYVPVTPKHGVIVERCQDDASLAVPRYDRWVVRRKVDVPFPTFQKLGKHFPVEATQLRNEFVYCICNQDRLPIDVSILEPFEQQ